MSVGASTTHNLVRYSDESYSECQCVKRSCVVCNPNPTSDLIFEQREVNEYLVSMNDRNFRDLDRVEASVGSLMEENRALTAEINVANARIERLTDLFKDTQAQVRMMIDLNEIMTRRTQNQTNEIAALKRRLDSLEGALSLSELN